MKKYTYNNISFRNYCLKNLSNQGGASFGQAQPGLMFQLNSYQLQHHIVTAQQQSQTHQQNDQYCSCVGTKYSLGTTTTHLKLKTP